MSVLRVCLNRLCLRTSRIPLAPCARITTQSNLQESQSKAEERIYGSEDRPWMDGFDAFVQRSKKASGSVWTTKSNSDSDSFVPQRTVVASRLWEVSRKIVVDPSIDRTKMTFAPKKITDSFSEVIIPFSSNPGLRDLYSTSDGRLRFGLLLEDLDAFAGHVAYKHCENPSNPAVHNQVIVTASVNRIDLLNKLHSDRDLRFRGCVTWVGRSSMNIMIKVSSCRTGVSNDQTRPSDWNPIISANFMMVARCPNSNTAVPVPRLDIQNDLEQRWFDEGEESHKTMLQMKESSVFNKPPTASESELIHSLYLENSKDQDSQAENSFKYMNQTATQSAIFCHPQERNIHNKIFGGFLMRQAYDLAFTNAYLYAGDRPYFLALDDISFLKPVEIGSICDFKSKVVYAQGYPSGSIQVQVSAEVVNPKLNTRDITNVFHFIFASPTTPVKKSISQSVSLTNQFVCMLQLIPQSYSDFLVYLDAMRRHVRGRDKRVAASLVQSY